MKNKILVTKPSIPPYEEYCVEIKEIWDNEWLTNIGPKHQKFEAVLTEYFNAENIALFTNGHLALEIALKALDLKGEVITTPFTFVSTVHAIVNAGLKPVFCDIKPDDYTINTDIIEKLITPRTAAILPVHVYGNICDFEKIQLISKKYKLKVIYDAAHAFGEIYDGINIANLGDITMFSFHATKVFNTIEGGCLVSKDKKLIEKCKQIANFGQEKAEAVMLGTNAKMSEFQASMGLCNLRHIDDWIEKRKKIVERYVYNLKDNLGIKLNFINKKLKSNYSYFPVLTDKIKLGKSRDELCEILEKNNIFSRKYFYPAINDMASYKGAEKTPIAKHIANNILCLPLYPALDFGTIDKICDIINKL